MHVGFVAKLAQHCSPYHCLQQVPPRAPRGSGSLRVARDSAVSRITFPRASCHSWVPQTSGAFQTPRFPRLGNNSVPAQSHTSIGRFRSSLRLRLPRLSLSSRGVHVAHGLPFSSKVHVLVLKNQSLDALNGGSGSSSKLFFCDSCHSVTCSPALTPNFMSAPMCETSWDDLRESILAVPKPTMEAGLAIRAGTI